MKYRVAICTALISVFSFALAATAKEPEPIKLFNGKDLTGWEEHGKAAWTVKDGILIGKQGENNAPGDLLTKASYDNFELTIEYRVVWPANTGLWYRYQSARQAYQADILEYKNPFALSGTIYCPGKMFIAINKDDTAINREGWNKMTVRAAGDHHVVTLNGKKVAEAHDDSSDKGRIGFQVHAGNQFGKMEVQVKSVVLHPLK